MKNIPFLLTLLSLTTFALGCDKCKSSCESDADISAVLPNNNPVGYEVLLKTSGLPQSAKVVFGTVEATTRPGGESGEIIATVPNGLSGNVEISVEDGECIVRSAGFVVSGSLPDNVQASLPQIIIPTPLPQSSIPTEGFTNYWVNAADPIPSNSGINLIGSFAGGLDETSLEEDSKEFDFTNPAFNENPATGTLNRKTNVIYVEVDRTLKGGNIERFDGLFIEVPSFLPPNAQYAILLTSRETGRQLLLYAKQ